VPGTGYTTANCKAYAVLIPSTQSTVTVGAAGLLSWLYSADQSANAHAGFDYSTAGSSVTRIKPIQGKSAGTVTAFTCVVHVPYTFTDAVGGQSIAVMYDVTASDNSPYVSGYGLMNPLIFERFEFGRFFSVLPKKKRPERANWHGPDPSTKVAIQNSHVARLV